MRQKIKQRIPRDALLVLIDDTVTTGSTLLYAAEVVREAFPSSLAFARTSLRGLVANNNGFLYYASVRCNLDEISARRSCTQIIRFA